MRKEISIPIPRRLCAGVFYNSRSKQYCAVGYLMRHLCGFSPKREIGWDYEDKLEEILPEYEDLREKIVDGNNDAPTQKARIANFKKFCGMLGVKLIAR